MNRYQLFSQRKAQAFTLVELLVVMMILGILASIVLFALAGVQESAKRDKTAATINKINAIVMAKYESYRTRRMPISIPAGTPPLSAAKYRLDAVRDMMRMEMPDSYADIDNPPVTKTTLGGATSIARPSVNLAYGKALPPVAARNSNVVAAKCLYLVVVKGSDDPDVLEEFSPGEIATDPDDGMHYFVDGWGNAIRFMRWAPGFRSALQSWDLRASPKIYPTSHDPFDPMGVYRPSGSDAFYNPSPGAEQFYPPLFPLIYSSGGEKDTEIEAAPGIVYSTVNNNPYYGATTPSGPIPGDWLDTNSDGIDDRGHNITNHDLSEQ